MRARMSAQALRQKKRGKRIMGEMGRRGPPTFLVGIQDIIVGVAQGKAVGHGWELLAVQIAPELVVGERLEKLALRIDGAA